MLIYPEKDEDKIQFRIRIKASVYKEIEDYCEWAEIQYKDYFIQRACQYIFTNDESWIKHKNQKIEDNPSK
jgi:hypothetical protein